MVCKSFEELSNKLDVINYRGAMFDADIPILPFLDAVGQLWLDLARLSGMIGINAAASNQYQVVNRRSPRLISPCFLKLTDSRTFPKGVRNFPSLKLKQLMYAH